MRTREDDREQAALHDHRTLRPVTVALAGSRTLRGIRLAGHLAEKIAALPAGSVILLRRGIHQSPGWFEKLAEELARLYNIKVEYRIPMGNDRAMVFRRDYQMVDDADYVEAYFPIDRVMEGGTGHVVEAALNRERRVYAWSVDTEGRIGRIGELEPSINRYSAFG